MVLITEDVVQRRSNGGARPDLATSPFPLGVPFFTPWVSPEATKAASSVFGLVFCQPYADYSEVPPFTYDADLQVMVPDGVEADRHGFMPRMITFSATIEQTPATGTITNTGCGCSPDRDRDTDATDRMRD